MINKDSQHAAIDGIGNLFKACTVPVIESVVSSSSGTDTTSSHTSSRSLYHGESSGSIVDPVILSERKMLSMQLRSVLEALGHNLERCVNYYCKEAGDSEGNVQCNMITFLACKT